MSTAAVRCPQCDYDLNGLLGYSEGRCPECGAEVSIRACDARPPLPGAGRLAWITARPAVIYVAAVVALDLALGGRARLGVVMGCMGVVVAPCLGAASVVAFIQDYHVPRGSRWVITLMLVGAVALSICAVVLAMLVSAIVGSR